MKSIEEAEIIEGTIVMVRVDWNEPLDRFGANPKDVRVLDTSRIEASAETINFILNKGGKVIVV
ncbi:MAG TPA: phosphoglycerate kinase, partial [Candidatus Paceibacterota bacterium]